LLGRPGFQMRLSQGTRYVREVQTALSNVALPLVLVPLELIEFELVYPLDDIPSASRSCAVAARYALGCIYRRISGGASCGGRELSVVRVARQRLDVY
jgi:hypothetical protein